jgi:Plasmid pRiA4b ORF-3-like protein
MAVLKFRAYFEDDDSVYRDIVIKHTQTFADLHSAILKAYEFDNKHQATFFRSNDSWQRGREITLEKYDKNYLAEPLLMAETPIGSEIKDPNQKFVYTYDFVKGWAFLVELINVSKVENAKTVYPSTIRVEGIGPAQYGTKSLLGDKFIDIEEKYDLSAGAEGFGSEGVSDNESESENDSDDAEDSFDDASGQEEEYV